MVKTLHELNRGNIRFACSNVVVYKGKENTIFNDWAKDYNVTPIRSNYISYHDNSVKTFTEVLVKNYE